MPLFLVRYVVVHVGHYGSEIIKERAHHALLVDSPTSVDAFVTAYDYLSRQGFAVSTMLTDKYKALEWNPDEPNAITEPTNHCGMSDKDLDELKLKGIAVDKFEGSVMIISITEHKPKVLGHVVSAQCEADQHTQGAAK
jgi:hypothetical protein